MLTKAKIKYIKSLQLKKYRQQEQCFLVEGEKNVIEFLTSDYQVDIVAGVVEMLQKHSAKLITSKSKIYEVKEKLLSDIGSFKNNNSLIAVVQIPKAEQKIEYNTKLNLVLDDIQDPGNMGTIIRIADWYGIENIFASITTTDIFNPKVVNATMGSLTRVKVRYTNLEKLLSEYKGEVYGAYLAGNSIHEVNFAEAAMLVIGNESKGISDSVEKYISKKITIPRYGGAESLNAAMATAIICDNISRKS